ncbi:MAG: DNA repair exonuclease [Oligoflexia bacterium]|nr:DNA repair exonuclease [Oligoflexia bacterium]
MVSFIQTSDLHLGASFAFLGDKARGKRQKQLEVWDNIIDICVTEKVDFLLIAGDLFDSNKIENEILDTVGAGLRRLKENGIETVIIPGTHDPFIAGRGVLGDPRVFINARILADSRNRYKFKNREGQNITVYGFGYEAGTPPSVMLDKIKRDDEDGVHIGALHCSLIQNPDWNYRSVDFPVTEEMLAGLGLDYIALGHYHDYSEIIFRGKIIAAYAGSPEGVKTTETDARHILKIEIDDNLKPGITAVKSNLTEFVNSEINISSDEELELYLRENSNPDAILKLVVKGFTQKLEIPRKHGFLHLIIDDKTIPYDMGDLCDRVCTEKTIRGEFARMVVDEMQNGDRELYQEVLKEVFVRLGGI